MTVAQFQDILKAAMERKDRDPRYWMCACGHRASMHCGTGCVGVYGWFDRDSAEPGPCQCQAYRAEALP